jgi:hypothetical protein
VPGLIFCGGADRGSVDAPLRPTAAERDTVEREGFELTALAHIQN